MSAVLAPGSNQHSTELPDSRKRSDVIDSLRAEIGSIERRSSYSVSVGVIKEPSQGAWTFEDHVLDALVGPVGLEIGAVHEVKPSSMGDGSAVGWAALCASGRRFALALAARRLATAQGARQDAPVLVCSSAAQAAEIGSIYAIGLAGLGLDPHRLIVAEPAKSADVLWAVEQGLASHGLALVIGEIADVDLTPARRLALAAARSLTPCVLLTHPRAAPVAATSTRWRISPAPGAPDPFDGEAPGTARLAIALERCRTAPGRSTSSTPLLLEWCDAAYRFRVAASMADRSARKSFAAIQARFAVGLEQGA